MSGYAEYDLPDEFNIGYLPTVVATNHSLRNLGNLVDDFDDEKVIIEKWPLNGPRKLMPRTGLGPVTQGDFRVWWEDDLLHGENHSVESGLYNIARVHPKDKDILLTREMNYHPDGGQVIFPKERKPFLVLLGNQGDDIQWDLHKSLGVPGYQVTKFACFYFDGSKGLHIHPNVWHQPPIPLTEELEFKDKQGAVHGCVGYDSVKEHDLWMAFNRLSIPGNSS